jgi:predicted phage terminase large subunit-like protein
VTDVTVSSTGWAEHAARQFEASRWSTPAACGDALDPHRVRTPALDLIDAAIVRTIGTPDGRLIVSMPPQEGKSQLAARFTPLWALHNDPDLRVGIVSYELGMARRWGRAVRDDVVGHAPTFAAPGPDGRTRTMRVRPDLSAQHEWQLDGHQGGVYAAGIGGAVTGRPIDLLIIDDPLKGRLEAESAVYRERAWDSWTDVLSTRLSPGAPVLLILTRWHHDDLAARLTGADDGRVWETINIPAQADHDPGAGESDPLGRAPGEFMTSARGRTVPQWEATRARSARTWTALYQGRPVPSTGGMFPRDAWSRYDQAVWIDGPGGTRLIPGLETADAELVQSWDMTFKGHDKSDFVVGQVWYRRGVDCWLVDQVRARLTFPQTCQAVETLSARWPQATLKLIEDKANGPAVIAQLARTVPGIVPEEPHGSKTSRAAAITPLIEAGNVHIPAPSLCPWIGDLVEEAAEFPAGAHDDQIDAMSQALTRLILAPVAAGALIDMTDDDDEPAMPYLASMG